MSNTNNCETLSEILTSEGFSYFIEDLRNRMGVMASREDGQFQVFYQNIVSELLNNREESSIMKSAIKEVSTVLHDQFALP